MASLEEIRSIGKGSGLAWDTIAEPYPEIIDDPCGARHTLGWCLLCQNDDCCFLRDGFCTIDANRTWICRTCPFMLDRDGAGDSECEGLGQAMYQQETTIIVCTPPLSANV